MHYQWVPAHVGIEGNEEANSLANDMHSQSTPWMQMQHEMKQKKFLQATTNNCHHSGY